MIDNSFDKHNYRKHKERTMISNARIAQLKDYIYKEFLVDNVDVDAKMFDDISDCLDELLAIRERKNTRKSVEKWRCGWCGKYRTKSPEWEQMTIRGKWLPLCSYCARRRLDNPFNALLNIRRMK